MRMKWILLALLLGVFVGGFVLLRPQRPLWTQPIPACHELVQYSEDGKSLIVAEGLEINNAVEAKPALVYYDLQSGQETRRIPLTFPDKTFNNRFWISPDVKILVILASISSGESSPHEYTDIPKLYSYDIATGRLLNGPLNNGYMDDLQFSRDRKWFCYTKPVEDRSDLELSAMSDFSCLRSNINIVSTADFRIMHAIPFNPSTRTFHEFCFFEDESKLAILSTKWPGKSALQLLKESPEKLANLQQVLEVLDLETGKVMQAYDMPTTHKWDTILKADSNHVYLQGMDLHRVSAGEPFRDIICMTFDGKKNAMAIIDPTLSSYAQTETAGMTGLFQEILTLRRFENFGDDWVAHSVYHDRSKVLNAWKSTIDWLDAKCGTTIMNWIQSGESICIIDRKSGSKRLEVPTVRHPLAQMLISRDGHYLALADYEKPGLELWDANPGSRWPYAIAAGVVPLLLAFVLVRSIKRYRTKAVVAG